MIKLQHFNLNITFILFVVLSLTIHAQNLLPFSVISSGGQNSLNESFIMNGTVGKAFIGKSVSVNNHQYSGFWYVYKADIGTPVENEETFPTEFKLQQNYPNPFNPSTMIKFSVPERSNVLIKIYDILGGEVATIVNEEIEAGWYTRVFNATGYSTGVYIYRMQAGNYTQTRKMLLIK